MSEHTKSNRWKREIIIFGISGFLILLFAWNLRRTSPNREGAKLQEVQALSAKVPVFPGFAEVGSHTKSSYGMVDLTKHYFSNANFSDVKAFYEDTLAQDGWILVNENAAEDKGSKEIKFKKGHFFISIFHTKDSSVYNYAIDFVWQGTDT